MLEEILLYAIRFENCLPPVENKNNTGWWPHYDLEYPDPDKKIVEGNVEVYYAVLEWMFQIPKYDQRVIYAYLGTGHRVSDEAAAKKLKTSVTSLVYSQSYLNALRKIAKVATLEKMKDIYKRYIL